MNTSIRRGCRGRAAAPRLIAEIGVIAALERGGLDPGDEVRIGEEFELDPG